VTSKGATIWFTGLPASGKSSIARAVYQQLLDRGCATELLDGAEVRESLSRGLGFSREDREENVRRIGFVAKLLARNGVIAICAAVSPYRGTRDEVRRNSSHFIEVHVDCPVEVAAARDTDGLYAKALRGELSDFTGVDAPYEAPLHPEVYIDSARESIEEGAGRVIAALERSGVIPARVVGRLDLQEDALRRVASSGSQ
jgi:adenylyl-sulfate kinase